MANYKSNYTGAEIDGTVTKLIDIPQEPTEEHIGEVIGVVEGEGRGANPKYGLVPMSGGNEDFVVTFSGTTEGGDAACDKTLSEIAEAYSRGANIKAVYLHPDNDVTEIFNLTTNLVISENVCIELAGWYLTAEFFNNSPTVRHAISCSINVDGVWITTTLH